MLTRWLPTMVCALGLLLRPGVLPAADDAPVAGGDRPRIGLVLSGGGARGAAHVGVLRALEEMRIPIDAVAGTSMGAVVGGLYSAGLSGAEIAEVFGALDWQDLVQDRAPRRDLVYRRKQDDRNFLARTALGVRGGEGVVLPLGLVQGQKITQVLRNATLRVADVQDFDQLPTPFRALATDLESGEAVVMGAGDLVTVMRASMSAPGVLAPVEIGGRLLVDGGLVDNLPVSLARANGRGRPDRRGRELPARDARRARVAARRHQPDGRHHGAPGHGRVACRARGQRHPDRARPRSHDLGRVRTHTAGDHHGRVCDSPGARQAGGAGPAGGPLCGLPRGARAYARSGGAHGLRARRPALAGGREANRCGVR